MIGRLAIAALAAAAIPLFCARASDDGSPSAAATSATPLVVYCYDPSRDTVARKLAGECRGTAVSEAQANEIRERRARYMARAINATRPSPPAEGTRLASIGTAFFVDHSGKLLTNNHVVEGCKAVAVETAAGDTLPAEVLAVDAADDLALLQVAVRPPAIASFRSQALTEAGTAVSAVGYPDQGLPPRQPSITRGTFQASPAASPRRGRLAIDADIRPGNSGGPVVDNAGLVIGIVNARIDTVGIYRRTGKVLSDLGFGIPLPRIFDFMKRHGARFQIGHEGDALSPSQLIRAARAYVVRADCWR